MGCWSSLGRDAAGGCLWKAPGFSQSTAAVKRTGQWCSFLSHCSTFWNGSVGSSLFCQIGTQSHMCREEHLWFLRGMAHMVFWVLPAWSVLSDITARRVLNISCMRTSGCSVQFPWKPQNSREIQPWTQGHLFYHWLLVCKMLKLSADRDVAAAGLEWCFLWLFDLGFLNFSWTAVWFQPGWLFGAVLRHKPASVTEYQTCYIKYQNGYGKALAECGCWVFVHSPTYPGTWPNLLHWKESEDTTTCSLRKEARNYILLFSILNAMGNCRDWGWIDGKKTLQNLANSPWLFLFIFCL